MYFFSLTFINQTIQMSSTWNVHKTHTDLLRRRLLAVRADKVAVCFQPGQVLQQFLSRRTMLVRQIMKTNQQPHLGFAEKALPTTASPTLGLLSPASAWRCSRPGSWRLVIGLTRIVWPLLLPILCLPLPVNLSGWRWGWAGVQGENRKFGHGRGSSQSGRAVRSVRSFAARCRSRGTLVRSRALPTCYDLKKIHIMFEVHIKHCGHKTFLLDKPQHLQPAINLTGPCQRTHTSAETHHNILPACSGWLSSSIQSCSAADRALSGQYSHSSSRAEKTLCIIHEDTN